MKYIINTALILYKAWVKGTDLFLYTVDSLYSSERYNRAGLKSFLSLWGLQEPCLTFMKHRPGLWPRALKERREGLDIQTWEQIQTRRGQSPHLVGPSRMTTDRVPSTRDLESFLRRRFSFLIMRSISWSYTNDTLGTSLNRFTKGYTVLNCRAGGLEEDQRGGL